MLTLYMEPRKRNPIETKRTKVFKKKDTQPYASGSVEGQADQGAGRMPWHQEPKKDVISCEKLRGAANGP